VIQQKNRFSRSSDVVIGLDASTTATKAMALDQNGNVVAQSRRAIPLASPVPHSYEQDPDDWWRSAQYTLRAITDQIDPLRIAALSISNQRETFVPLNRDGRSIRPAIVWLDERCKDEVEPFARKVGKKKIHRITGKPADYAPVVYRLAWLKKNEPDAFGKIHKICDVHTYLVWKLTRSFKTSWASADPLGLFDLKKKRWSPIVLRSLELKEDQLPDVCCPGTIVGTVSREAAESTGLSAGTLVVTGGGDGQAAGLGVNALASRRAYLNLGTAVVSGIFARTYRTSTAFRTMSSCSESGYYYECSLRAGTFAIDWFIRHILQIDPSAQPDIYKQLETSAQRVPVGSDRLLHLPYLCGVMNPYWDMDARGAFIGLSSFHKRGHIYRSILEGIAFEQTLATRSVEKIVGAKVRDFVAVGGGAASEIWCRIFADISGKNVCLPENTEAPCLGAAICAAIGAGWYRTFREAA
jgi:sugar (pentulose or hexulose) kinase